MTKERKKINSQRKKEKIQRKQYPKQGSHAQRKQTIPKEIIVISLVFLEKGYPSPRR